MQNPAREPARQARSDAAQGPQSGDQVDVSILIPVLNEETHIRDTVRGMQAQRFDGRLEFLFADGRSEDRTRAILEELARHDASIRVLDNPARHTAAGLNACLREARGTYVARMDGHAFYPPDYVRLGVERLARGDVGWVSGPQVPRPVGRVSRGVALALDTWLGRGASRKWRSDAAGDQEASPGGEFELDTGVFGGVWRRDLLLAHGGWDERWPINQDSELAARFIEHGQRIVCLPAMGARYIPRNSFKSLARQHWRYGIYRARTARHHPESLRRSYLGAPGLALTTLAALIAPRPARIVARAGLVAYGVGIGSVTARAAARIDEPRDAAVLPAVFVVMHLMHGFGFIGGSLRFGVPISAIAQSVGLKRPPAEPHRGGQPAASVFAPTLDAE
jgi:succinoglycan biosynthesis protein ExoA